MRKLLLAGDIGGTKTNLAIYAAGAGGRLSMLREATFPSRRYDGLEKIVGEFVAAGRERVRAAAFGVAGPVVEDRVKTTNLPWVVRSRSLARLLGCPRIRLMNDLEATAYGGLFLNPKTDRMARARQAPPSERRGHRRRHRPRPSVSLLGRRAAPPRSHRGRPRRLRAAQRQGDRAPRIPAEALRASLLRAPTLGPRPRQHLSLLRRGGRPTGLGQRARSHGARGPRGGDRGGGRRG